MKIIKNTYDFRNVIIFVLFSIVFLLAINALVEGALLFSKDFLVSGFKKNFLTITLGVLTAYTVFTFKKHSQWVVLFFIILVTVKSFVFLAMSFNKLILILNFIYLLFSFYFFSIWELFILKAAHVPKFSSNDLIKHRRFLIEGRIINPTNESADFKLTNLDESSCFVMLNDYKNIELKLKDIVTIQITIDGCTFKSIAKCVALYDLGAGFSFEKDELDRRSLSGLCQVCRERGLF